MWLVLPALLASSVAHAADLDAMCVWKGANWDQSGELMVPGTDVTWGYVHGHDGVLVDGTLGFDEWGRVVFRADLRGAGLALHGDFDLTDDTVFALDGTDVPLGVAGLLVHGAMFTVAGRGPDGAVLVGPHAWASEAVWAPQAFGVIRCQDITVHWRPVPEEPVMLAAAGFSADLPVSWLPKGRSATLYAGPNGPWIGEIRKAKYTRILRVAEERDGFAHVVLPHWTGTVWHGWVRSSRLREPAEGGLGSGGILGALGAAAEPIPVRSCTSDMPLRARVGRHEFDVGTVLSGTPMKIDADDGATWTVSFPRGWVYATEGASLRVAADPTACPEGVLEPEGGSGTGVLGNL